jgi:hypothetical protein
MRRQRFVGQLETNLIVPLPVQPCASASQPVASATSTCFLASSGRAIDVPSRYLCSYTPPERTSFHRYSLTNSSRMSATWTSDAPVLRAFSSARQFIAALADVAAHGDHFAAVVFLQPRNDDGRIEAARVGERHFLRFHKLFSARATSAAARHRLAEQHQQQRLLRVQAVLGLIENHRLRRFDDFVGHFFAALGRQAMHEHRVGPASAISCSFT